MIPSLYTGPPFEIDVKWDPGTSINVSCVPACPVITPLMFNASTDDLVDLICVWPFITLLLVLSPFVDLREWSEMTLRRLAITLSRDKCRKMGRKVGNVAATMAKEASMVVQ